MLATFWYKIRDVYNQEANKKGFQERTKNMLTGKWIPMNAAVMKFNKLYKETLAHSGENNENHMARVLQLYETIVEEPRGSLSRIFKQPTKAIKKEEKLFVHESARAVKILGVTWYEGLRGSFVSFKEMITSQLQEKLWLYDEVRTRLCLFCHHQIGEDYWDSRFDETK
ncbi:hypothetical protein Tco_0695011 [Tanacetum coccineum]